MPSFLHGVETIDVTTGARPITGVKSSVIGLIGTAPIWEVDADNQKINTPVLVLSVQDAAKYFGTVRPGYTIPQALKAIADQGKGIVVVVNVFDPAVHKTAVALANHVLDADDEVKLVHPGISTVVVKDSTGVTTYVLNTDYTVDAVAGVIARKEGSAFAVGATLKVSYSFADPSLVDSDDIIGTVDGSGDRTGLQALDDVPTLFGFGAKILIAPAYATQAAVVAALAVRAAASRAIALVDAPIGTTVDDAITGRGPDGAINFESSSPRVFPCYPHFLIDDGNGGTITDPLSQRLAGVIAAVDNAEGFHVSPSNHEVLGVIGMERSLTARINDPSSEVNQLNAVGITTILNAFGTGFRIWGNRSAAFPASSDPITFMSVQRTEDMIDEAIESAMLQFLDGPLDAPRISAIQESVNAYIRIQIGRGALVDGACTFDPADNPTEELELGHLTLGVTYMPPTPTEKITVKRFLDQSLLRALTGAQG